MKRQISILLAALLFMGIIGYVSQEYWAITPLAKPHKQNKLRTANKQTLQVIRRVETPEKIIALTFDDGPHPKFTPLVLKVLKKHKAHGTFFILGHHADRHPELVNQIVSNGNEVAVHSYNHFFLNRLSSSQVENQIDRTYKSLFRITGHQPALFRPPYGFYNKNMLSLAAKKNLKVVLWTPTADPRDYDDPGAAKIAGRVLSEIKPGSIVLLHDHGGNRAQTVEAVDKIITTLKTEGYKFETVSHLINVGQVKKVQKP